MNALRLSSSTARLLCAVAAALFFSTWTARAHKPSDSYLTINVEQAQLFGEWHLSLRDLEYVLGLDANQDEVITWRELRDQEPAVAGYAVSRLHLWNGTESLPAGFNELLVENHSDGAYAVLRFKVKCPHADRGLKIDYTAFFDVDPSHRGLLRLNRPGSTQLAVFGPESRVQTFVLGQGGGQHAFGTFIPQGAWHIWSGYDHLLFLVALLLGAALCRGERGCVAQSNTQTVLKEVLKTVTAFTVAHSLTLSATALGWIHPPSRVVESGIAFSVLLAAANNLVPVLPGRGWVIAFVFGLVHGFGFANALGDLGLRGAELVPALFGFNVGVELGQLSLVAVCLPLMIGLRWRPVYIRVVVPGGSLGIAIIAGFWLAERAFNVSWSPF